jgi:hypothetical protein
MVKNAQALDDSLEGSDIRYMTWVLLFDAPDSVWERWAASLFSPVEFSMRQSTWRIILQVDASGVEL